MTASIRLLIADDDPIVREVLTSALGSETDIEVVAVVANGAEAVDVVHARTVDVVLMDVQMPVLDGVAATSRILALGGGTRVLLLTTFDDDSFLDGGLAAGASGFLLKTTPPERIAEAIRTVRTGGEVPSPGPANRLGLRARGRGPAATIPDPDLTDRERRILRLLCRARTNHQIARRLDNKKIKIFSILNISNNFNLEIGENITLLGNINMSVGASFVIRAE